MLKEIRFKIYNEALDFVIKYRRNGSDFLINIVTNDFSRDPVSSRLLTRAHLIKKISRIRSGLYRNSWVSIKLSIIVITLAVKFSKCNKH